MAGWDADGGMEEEEEGKMRVCGGHETKAEREGEITPPSTARNHPGVGFQTPHRLIMARFHADVRREPYVNYSAGLTPGQVEKNR